MHMHACSMSSERSTERDGHGGLARDLANGNVQSRGGLRIEHERSKTINMFGVTGVDANSCAPHALPGTQLPVSSAQRCPS